MALAFVNSVSGQASSSTTVTTSAIAVTGGNLLVVGTINPSATNGISDDATTPITDSAGNTYTKVGTSPLSGQRYCELFYAKNVTGGASVTFTYHLTVAQFPRIFVVQFSGADTTAPLDQGAAGTFSFTGSTSSQTTPSITTTVANEVLIAFDAYGNCSACTHTWADGGCTTNSGTWATPEDMNDTSCTDGSIGYAIVSATGTYCASVSYSAAGFDDSCGIASFKAASVASVTPPLLLVPTVVRLVR